MPRPGPRSFEKSKDFKGSIKRLFHSLKNWHSLLTIALILAMTSSILSLVAPNKLSDLTDTITSGIKPNLNEEVINEIMTDTNISDSDKQEFSIMLSKMAEEKDSQEILKLVDSLPEAIKERVEPSIDMSKVKNIALFLATIYILSSIFGYIQGYTMTTVSNNYAKIIPYK